MALDLLDDLLETEDPLDSAMDASADDAANGFDFQSHLTQMDAAVHVANHGLGAVDENGTLLQGGLSTGLGATNQDGSLQQSFGIRTSADIAAMTPKTVYPILAGPGPRVDKRFDSFAAAKTLAAPKTPGVYTSDKVDTAPKITPATMPSAFQTPVYPKRQLIQ